MTERLVIDYAWNRPAAAAIKAAGYEGVVRYISRTASKDLTTAERDALRAHNLSIALVWETTANRAGDGREAGIADATKALEKANALGYPPGCVLFFAVDFDAHYADVRPYFDGVRATVRGRPVGGYAGLAVVESLMRAGLVDVGWQTVAWSGGKVSAIAHLYQRIKPTRPLAGDFDENVVLRGDYGQWKAGSPPPAPKPDEPKWTEVANVKTTYVQVTTDEHGNGWADLRTKATPIAALVNVPDPHKTEWANVNAGIGTDAQGDRILVLTGAPAKGRIGVWVTVAA